MSLTESKQRELVRQLAAVAVTVDKLPAESDREWLNPHQRQERRSRDEAAARRQPPHG
jgi:hypothetical protein